jgi:hypothetical protein
MVILENDSYFVTPTQERLPLEFFLSKKDKSYLLVVDLASRSGNLFKVVGEDTWTLVWSGLVTKEFLENPDWEWETTQRDPARFQGGWPKLRNGD